MEIFSSSGMLRLYIIDTLTYLVPFLSLLITGYIVGRIIETRHFKNLAKRELEISKAIPTNLKNISGKNIGSSFMVIGAVVIASDYYKTVGARIKSIFGGNLSTLESLMERGRREALLRMREQAAQYGADLVLNVRFETSSISRSENGNSMPNLEIMAYGTAVVFSS